MRTILLLTFLLTSVLLEGTLRHVFGEDSVAAAPLSAEVRQAPFTSPVNCRYGVNNLTGWESNQWIAPIGAGFYLNFRTQQQGPPVPPEVEHIPQIRVEQGYENGYFLPTREIKPPLDFSEEGLGTIVRQQPGRLWLVGNEVDVNNTVQDRMTPQMYAETYHDVYHFIKALDPTAQVANAALSMATPGRLQYLDIVWDTYLEKYGEEMPVDVWNFHLYILSERNTFNDTGQGDGRIAIGTDPELALLASNGNPEQCSAENIICRAEHDSLDIFKQQVVAMRQWMKDHGQQDKPLILSEYSLLFPFLDYDDALNPSSCYLMDEFGNCFTPTRVSNYMQETMAYLASASDPDLGYPDDDYKLVQQWKWYSMYTKPEWSGSSSNLLREGYESLPAGDLTALTLPGETFRAIVAAQPTAVNLVASRGSNALAVADASGTASPTLEVGFYNDGSTGVADPFTVTFYADEALTQEIASAEIAPDSHGVINGCSWGRTTDTASVVWPDLPVGTHRYWAKIDSGNAISAEMNERDNVISGTVQVTAHGTFVPIVQR